MLAFYVVAFAIFAGSAVVAVDITRDFGYAVSAFSAAILSSASLVIFGFFIRNIEQKFGIQIIERPR